MQRPVETGIPTTVIEQLDETLVQLIRLRVQVTTEQNGETPNEQEQLERVKLLAEAND